LKSGSGSRSVHGLFFGFGWGNHLRSSESDRVGPEDAVDDGLDGSINGLGLVVDNAGFGAGACTTFVDPWSGPSGAELDDACASDDSTGFPNVLKYASARLANLSKCSNPRFPNTVISSLGMCTTSTHA
jgi:hypothetical protein